MSTPSSGLVLSADPPPIFPDLGVPPHMPDLDGVSHPCDLGPGSALEPGSSHAGTVPAPGPHARREGTASRDAGSGWCSQIRRRQHHPSPKVSKQGSQQLTEQLDHTAGRKRSQGVPGPSIFLFVCLQGPVLTPQADCAVAALS